ncbi:MAG: hypothetical protein KTR31_37150 [Myxococcales bacterium]|nr:hypothetical protein [Myxococcales bacterium]
MWWGGACLSLTSCAAIGALAKEARTGLGVELRERLGQEEAEPLLDTTRQPDATPPGVRVDWIQWNSGFRGSGLQEGDRIVAVDGRPIGARFGPFPGALAGKKITLTVLRRGTEHTIRGALRVPRQYSNGSGRPLLGKGGPTRLSKGPGGTAWASWYEDHVWLTSRVLAGAWQRHTFDSRMTLAELEEHDPWIEVLERDYPGPFTDAVVSDHERARESLKGQRRELTAEDLEYRDLGERRRKEVAQAAEQAHAAFLQRHEARLVNAFPAIDPVFGDRAAVSGKWVALPVIGNRQWVMSAGKCYLTAGDDADGRYIAPCESAGMRQVSDAVWRYGQSVGPDLRPEYELVGEVQPDLKMLVVGERSMYGLMVDVQAAKVGGALFVDVHAAGQEQAPFAGEPEPVDPTTVGPEASPTEVMQALFDALRRGDQTSFFALYANPRDPSVSSHWVTARRHVLSDVYGLDVVFEGAPHTVEDGVEKVEVEIEHIGLFDGEYRTFCVVGLHRMWTLQRRDQGPWRITSSHAI